MSCTKNSVTTTVTYKFFYPNCSNNNLLCRAGSGAWVPAVTVCALGL